MSSGTAVTAISISACAAAYPSEGCADYFDGNPVPPCVPPAGMLPTGAACGVSSQCRTTFCALSQTQVCGTCQPMPQAGATCQVAADCGRDLACAIPTGATSGRCAAFVWGNAPCLTGVAPCGASFGCVGDDVTTMTMGTCTLQGATLGAACDGARKAAAHCLGDAGLVCIPTAAGSAVGTCQNISLVSPGMTCGNIGSVRQRPIQLRRVMYPRCNRWARRNAESDGGRRVFIGRAEQRWGIWQSRARRAC
jgi:hypothetical protein